MSKEVVATPIEALLSRINQKVSELKLTPPIKLTADKFEDYASKRDWAVVSGRFVMDNKDDDAFIRDLVLLYLVKKEDNNLDQKFLTSPEDAGSSLHVIIRYNQQNFLYCMRYYSYYGKDTDSVKFSEFIKSKSKTKDKDGKTPEYYLTDEFKEFCTKNIPSLQFTPKGMVVKCNDMASLSYEVRNEYIKIIDDRISNKLKEKLLKSPVDLYEMFSGLHSMKHAASDMAEFIAEHKEDDGLANDLVLSWLSKWKSHLTTEFIETPEKYGSSLHLMLQHASGILNGIQKNSPKDEFADFIVSKLPLKDAYGRTPFFYMNEGFYNFLKLEKKSIPCDIDDDGMSIPQYIKTKEEEPTELIQRVLELQRSAVKNKETTANKEYLKDMVDYCSSNLTLNEYHQVIIEYLENLGASVQEEHKSSMSSLNLLKYYAKNDEAEIIEKLYPVDKTASQPLDILLTPIAEDTVVDLGLKGEVETESHH